MTASALTLLIVAILILWGGLAASVVALRVRPEIETYPAGGDGEDREENTVLRHDT